MLELVKILFVAHGKVVDASQEMAAVGMCNIIGAFFGSFPVNASFSRAAVSNASGIRTPLGGIYTSKIFIADSFFAFFTSYIHLLQVKCFSLKINFKFFSNV